MFFDMLKLHLLSAMLFQWPLPKLRLQVHYNTLRLISFAARTVVAMQSVLYM